MRDVPVARTSAALARELGLDQGEMLAVRRRAASRDGWGGPGGLTGHRSSGCAAPRFGRAVRYWPARRRLASSSVPAPAASTAAPATP